MADLTPEPNEYESFDVKGAVADIGESLFGEKPKDVLLERDAPLDSIVPEEKPAVEVAPVVDPNAPAPAIVPGLNSANPNPNQTNTPLPKSWKKEMAPVWEKADPAIKAYVEQREEQVVRGLGQYAGGYNNWSALITPFIPLLQQNPDVNPVHMMQGLMNTHLQLLNPNSPPQKKAELVNSLLREYGINLGPTDPNAPAPVGNSQEVLELRQEIQDLKRFQQSQVHRERYTVEQQNLTQVNAFAADPANKYFNEVGHDILRFIQTGAAADLASAYELACYANPAVRAKMLAEQPANPKPVNGEKPRDKSGQFINVDETPVKPRKPKIGSIDDTINGIVASHFAKH